MVFLYEGLKPWVKGLPCFYHEEELAFLVDAPFPFVHGALYAEDGAGGGQL